MKTLLLRSLSLLVLLLSSAEPSAAEQWRGIIPLKSTRADVDRLLGKPLPGNPDFLAKYKLRDEEVTINYADRKLCREADRCECLVPDGTVLDISVQPKRKVSFATLRIDQDKFSKHPLAENADIEVYYNGEAGLIYTISRTDGTLLYTQYAASSRDCEKIKNQRQTADRDPRSTSSLTLCRAAGYSVVP